MTKYSTLAERAFSILYPLEIQIDTLTSVFDTDIIHYKHSEGERTLYFIYNLIV